MARCWTKHGGTYKAAYHITNHLLHFYRDSVLAAWETQRLPVSKPMSATQFSLMMNTSGASGKDEQEIKKHLKANLGPGFCRNILMKQCAILARKSLRCPKVLTPSWTTSLTTCDSSQTKKKSVFCSILVKTMVTTLPVDSVWTRKTMRLCRLLSRRPLVTSSCQLVVA